MINIWHKRKDREGTFFRCGVCGEDRKGDGVFIQVANECLGIVCEGECAATARGQIRAQLRYAFPELDSAGYVLDAPASFEEQPQPDTERAGGGRS